MESIKIDNELIEKLYTELNEDMTVNIMNVRDKSMSVSAIRTKWVMKYFKENEMLKKLNKAKLQYIDKSIKELQVSDTSYRSMSRSRLEAHIFSTDEKVKKIDKHIDSQKEVLQFMEYVLNIVADFNFTVKHTLDALKLEQC